MLLNFFLYGIFIVVIALIFNGTAFKSRPASRVAAWSLAIVIFLISMVVITLMNVLTYEQISADLGVKVRPKNPISFWGPFMFSWLFFNLLKRQKKEKPPAIR